MHADPTTLPTSLMHHQQRLASTYAKHIQIGGSVPWTVDVDLVEPIVQPLSGARPAFSPFGVRGHLEPAEVPPLGQSQRCGDVAWPETHPALVAAPSICGDSARRIPAANIERADALRPYILWAEMVPVTFRSFTLNGILRARLHRVGVEENPLLFRNRQFPRSAEDADLGFAVMIVMRMVVRARARSSSRLIRPSFGPAGSDAIAFLFEPLARVDTALFQ